MNVKLASALRYSLFKFITPVSPIGRFAFPVISRRSYASEKDDSSDSASSGSEKTDDPPQEKQLIDVTEYYSQYIKEYEQGGFKDEESVQWELRKEKLNISRSRGETNVIDLEELVEFLRAERVKDICTIRMPESVVYTSHMVIGTPMSRRHMAAMTEKLRKAYKIKKAEYDPPMTRGIKERENQDWRVFDIGHTIVHMMSAAARKKYDIEMLWAVGEEHDDLTNAIGEMDEYTDRLKKLQQEVDMLSNSNSLQESEPQRKEM